MAFDGIRKSDQLTDFKNHADRAGHHGLFSQHPDWLQFTYRVQ